MPEVRASFERQLDRALQLSVGCAFMVGQKLTRDRRPYLVHCFYGEFFGFRLTSHRAAELGLAGDALDFSHARPQHNHGPKPTPAVWLDEVIVDRADNLNPFARITGTIRYRSAQSLRQPLFLSATCEPPGRGSVVFRQDLQRLDMIRPPGRLHRPWRPGPSATSAPCS
jgi:hypothetical protein